MFSNELNDVCTWVENTIHKWTTLTMITTWKMMLPYDPPKNLNHSVLEPPYTAACLSVSIPKCQTKCSSFDFIRIQVCFGWWKELPCLPLVWNEKFTGRSFLLFDPNFAASFSSLQFSFAFFKSWCLVWFLHLKAKLRTLSGFYPC